MFDKDNIDLSQYTHIFFSVPYAKKLNLFSMRSLYLEIFFLPKYHPIVSESVWCHKPDVSFNSHFAIDISNYHNLKIKDFDIKVDLFARNLLQSQHIGTVMLPLVKCETLKRTVPPVMFFYRQAEVSLVDPVKGKKVGRINVSCVFGRFDDAQFIDPTINFQLMQLKVNGGGFESLGIPERRNRKLSDVCSAASSMYGSYGSLPGSRGSLSPKVKSDSYKKFKAPSSQTSDSLLSDLSPISTKTPQPTRTLSRSSKELINILPSASMSPTRYLSAKEINEMLDEDTEDKIDRIIKDGLRNRFNIMDDDPYPEARETNRKESSPRSKDVIRFKSPTDENSKSSNTISPSKLETRIKKSPSLERLFEGMDISRDLGLEGISDSSSYEEHTTPRLVVNRK